MMDVAQQPMQEDRKEQARRIATERFQRESDWVAFYREVLGVDGLVDKLFPTPDQRNVFEKSSEFGEIQQMVAKLRERNRSQKQPDEPTRVITVRLPKSLHDSLRHEAHNHRTSMNKLCISKLLQVIDGELVPSDLERSNDTEPATAPPAVRPQVAAPSQISPLMPMPSPATMIPSHQRPFGIPAPMPQQTVAGSTF
jgi:hypothetical protein